MMTLVYRGKRLSSFYPNCAKELNPFRFGKYDWMTFSNIGEIESFLNYVKLCFITKEYSKPSQRVLAGLRFLE